jgi:hypothetical protein
MLVNQLKIQYSALPTTLVARSLHLHGHSAHIHQIYHKSLALAFWTNCNIPSISSAFMAEYVPIYYIYLVN